eukprot:9606514-Heterocapsa_arctica.AAC.1
MALGIVGIFSGTKIELMKELLATDPNAFRTIGPYSTPAGPPQGEWPEERNARSRSSDQRGRGGK